MAAATPVQAQEHNRLAIGLDYTVRASGEENGSALDGVGLRWRLGHDDEGWGWGGGLGWYTTDLERTIAGRRVPFGQLHVRPIVATYGYTHRISRRMSVKGGVAAGIAFTSLGMTEEAGSAIHALQADADTHVSGAVPILRPEAMVWYDVHPKFGLGVGVGYTIARPMLTTIAAPGVVTKERLHADAMALSIGVVYRVF